MWCNTRLFARVLFVLGLIASTFVVAQESETPTQDTKTQPTLLHEVDVVEHLDVARNQVDPSSGATSYSIDRHQLSTQSQGENASFNQVLVRAPGVAQDSFGQVHIRGEHADLQYRINGVLLPEGLSGFGQDIDTRFVDSVSLLTGALPAQYGYRTAGVADIRTKSGAFQNGGTASLYAGSFSTIKPSVEYSGNSGSLNYYFSGNYLQDELGIENPTSASTAIHDHVSQYKGFGYMSYVINDSNRLSLIISSSGGWFQIPNTPGLVPTFNLAATPSIASSNLDENQTELNDYAILAYQTSIGKLDLQAAVFSRFSSIQFFPDPVGDLIFNGVASSVHRYIISNGFQLDSSVAFSDKNTLRIGAFFSAGQANANTSTSVFATNAAGAQSSTIPFSIADNNSQWGFLYGFYAQDEWKLFDPLTINVGARFDGSNAYTNEFQLSPRANITYKPTDTTTIHGGYARYFTPPPLELVNARSVSAFNGTTNASPVTLSSPVLSERAHYFDLGVTQLFFNVLQLGLDGYYKLAQDQLDEGQFGQALIFSPFNYQDGDIHGVEFSATYSQNGLSAYTNLAVSQATGKQIASGEFLFPQDELNYVASNWVHLDHDQLVTGSFGASYVYERTTLYGDVLLGTGLRRGFANTDHLPTYSSFNVGIKHDFKIPAGIFQARFDIVNLIDQVYELRDGTGIGVGAPQYGQRLSFFGTLTFAFGGSGA